MPRNVIIYLVVINLHTNMTMHVTNIADTIKEVIKEINELNRKVNKMEEGKR